MTRLRETQATLNLENCEWIAREVECLGHVVSPGQLRVHKENTAALRVAKFRKTKTH